VCGTDKSKLPERTMKGAINRQRAIPAKKTGEGGPSVS
jgi:hypothetical protein